MEKSCLWFLYQLGVEFTVRLRFYLDEVACSCSEGEKPLITFFQDRVDQISSDLGVGIDYLAEYPPRDGRLDDREESRWLVDRYRSAAQALQVLHFDLRYLPTLPSISPEVYVFLSESFPKFFSQINPPVVYFPDYNFELTPVQAGIGPVILRIPYVEFRNPLMWANLVHEMGHAIDSKLGFTQNFFKKHPVDLSEEKPATGLVSEFFAGQIAIYTGLVSEFFADQIAIAIAGPSYLSAFICWYLASWYLAPDEHRRKALAQDSHPLPVDRIQAMKSYFADGDLLTKGAQFALTLFDEVEKLISTPETSPSGPQSISKLDMINDARGFAKSIDGLSFYKKSNATVVESLVRTLNEKTTIPSRFRAQAAEINRVFQTLNTGAFKDPEDVYSVAEILRETPNHPIEIVNAGWECKLHKSREVFYDILSNANIKFPDRCLNFGKYLINLERRLQKSVEVARVHKNWENVKKELEGEQSVETGTGDKNPQGKALEAPTAPKEPSLLNERQILARLCSCHPDRIVVTPILDIRKQLQPSSIDLRLGTEFALIRSSGIEFLDILKQEAAAQFEIAKYLDKIHILPDDKFVLHPGEFALGCTLEYIKLPADIAARLEGRSTWGRVGLQIHSTAGFVDPGFEGALTFELQNVGRIPIPLYPAMRVAQLCFYECEKSSIPYLKKPNSSYGGDPGLVFSRYFQQPDAAILRGIRDRKNKKA